MEGILESAVSGALVAVLEKLAALLGDEYKLQKGLHGEIRFLKDELAAIHAFLLKKSEEEDPDVQDKAWMAEVRKLSYDVEDSIDDFMQRVHGKHTKPDGFMDRIKNWFNFLEEMITRRGISKEIQDLKKQIIDVGERRPRYETREASSNTKNTTVDPRALVIYEQASKLVGIEKPKAEVIELLTAEDGSASTQQHSRKRKTRQGQEQLKLVSIVGSGGMGKTTLANQVYQELKGQFQCQAFVSVSRNPDEMNILRTILSEVSGQRYADTEAGSIQQLIGKISGFLAGKRYFIVIDDIWDEKTWDVIKCAFPMSSCGSRIITTTRINSVAESCRSSFNGEIYSIRPLNVLHSRQLFNRRLFDSREDCPSDLEEVSVQILEKCGGLPLAIIAISGLLANREKTLDLWNQVKDSIGRALERNPSVEGMMKILSLSYFDLPPYLKTCLLYLSIFPEDFVIEKKDLIKRWIVEGFIKKDRIFTVHEIGKRCFNELVNRSLIQPVEKNENGRAKEACRVHDTILDFIISKSIEENFVTFVGVPNLTVESQGKVRRISVQISNQGNYFTPASPALSHVRSLSVFGAFGHSLEIPSLDEFRHLRVLNFENCSQLKDHQLVNVGRLFQLRYLNLRNTRISELSEQIGHVRCLEMLDLRSTHVLQLPAAIVNLGKLSHLLVDFNVKFPDGIAKMQALEVLKVSLPEHPFDLMQDLAQLKNLRKLGLEFASYDDNEVGVIVQKECHKDVASSLRNLGTQSLRSLTIGDGSSCFLQQEGPLCPVPLTLQKLKIDDYDGSHLPQVPKWMGSLVNLQHLCLNLQEVRQEDLCILGALPALLFLELSADSISNSLKVSGELGFRCLRHFSYYLGDELDLVPGLVFAAGSMPKLEVLELSSLELSSDVDEELSRAFDIGIENLPCPITVKCEVRGSNRSVEATKAAIDSS